MYIWLQWMGKRGYRLLLSFLHRATSALTGSTPVMLPQTHGIYTLLTISTCICYAPTVHQLKAWMVYKLAAGLQTGLSALALHNHGLSKNGPTSCNPVRWFTKPVRVTKLGCNMYSNYIIRLHAYQQYIIRQCHYIITTPFSIPLTMLLFGGRRVSHM